MNAPVRREKHPLKRCEPILTRESQFGHLLEFGHLQVPTYTTHTAFMRQAVACATAVATYGGATYAAKEEIRALRSSAPHLQGDLLAADRVPLAPVPEPICAA